MANFLKQILIITIYVILSFSSSFGQVESTSVESLTTDTFNIKEIKTDFDSKGIYLLVDRAVTASRIKIDGESKILPSLGGKAYIDTGANFKGKLVFLSTEDTDQFELYHAAKLKEGGYRWKNIPLWLSLLPPLIAIILALVFKEVLVSLFIGIWAGAFIINGMRLDSFYYFISSMFDVVKNYIINAMNSTSHISIIVFSMLIGGMVAVISKNGGMAGVVFALSKYAKSPTSAQFLTWFLGVAIFFDDYANTLIVGNTMRPVTDKFKVSREKLAYLVDSTAAPVAAVAFITTWIGAELGYIDDGMKTIGLSGDYTPYSIFLNSLKYSYYTMFTLIFMLMIILMKRDFGPMYKAEIRARTTGRVSPAKTKSEDEPNMEDLNPIEGAPLKWINATLPVLAVVVMTIYGLFDTGFDALYDKLPEGSRYGWASIWNQLGSISITPNPGMIKKLGMVIGASDSYSALLWASLTGVIVALLMTVSGKIMSLFDSMHWLVTGFKTMIPALLILVLAWSLAQTTEQLHTAEYIGDILKGNINPTWLPMLIFLVAAFISFSTGSSWSTMAILYPIAIPATYNLCMYSGFSMDQTLELLYSVIATVLSASVLGDHCSPISDTTILSSLASDCNHIDHVKTQLPYALTVGGVALLCKGISSILGGGHMISLVLFILAIITMYFIILKFGKKVDDIELKPD